MTTPNPPLDLSADQLLRQNWLGVLARSPFEELTRRSAPILEGVSYTWLRQPETGLLRLQGRLDGAGDRFNLADMTVTRCAVKSEDGEVGIGYVTGRASAHCTLVARLDAQLQQELLRPTLLEQLIAPLQEQLQHKIARENRQTQTSRVRFFTLTPETQTL